jgi:LPXTG-motif cell wall-anchored protein
MNSLPFKAIAAFFAAMALFLAPVSASAYTPTAPDGDKTVTPGGSFTTTFTGFEPGESVTVTLTGPNAGDSTLNGQPGPSIVMVADANGNVTVTVQLPPGSKVGDEFQLTAVGERSGEATMGVSVVAPADGGNGDDDNDSTGSGNLSKTGGDLAPVILGVGGVLLLVGGGIVVAARRKKSEA